MRAFTIFRLIKFSSFDLMSCINDTSGDCEKFYVSGLHTSNSERLMAPPGLNVTQVLHWLGVFSIFIISNYYDVIRRLSVIFRRPRDRADMYSCGQLKSTN